jgi:two-component system alkaline phosphatase synthesis response regulator PhoP
MEVKILIADDESYVRLLMEQALEDLEDEGVEIFSVKDGTTALETIKTISPRLVFLDVMMPKMNGFDVCQTVKRELRMQDVYIVMLTAKGQEFDKQRGEEAGADIYMTKPFDPDELLDLARKILGLT